MIMDKTVLIAKENDVHVGAHPSLPDRQGFGRREMAIEPVPITRPFLLLLSYLLRIRMSSQLASSTKSEHFLDFSIDAP